MSDTVDKISRAILSVFSKILSTRWAALALGYPAVAVGIGAAFGLFRAKIQRALVACAAIVVVTAGATLGQILFATAHLASALCPRRWPGGGVGHSLLACAVAVAVTGHAQPFVCAVDRGATLRISTLARLSLFGRLEVYHPLCAMI